MNHYQFEIDIQVHDEGALAQAAFARALQEGVDADDARRSVWVDGEVDVSYCLIMLLDPGMSPAGTTIIGSQVGS